MRTALITALAVALAMPALAQNMPNFGTNNRVAIGETTQVVNGNFLVFPSPMSSQNTEPCFLMRGDTIRVERHVGSEELFVSLTEIKAGGHARKASFGCDRGEQLLIASSDYRLLEWEWRVSKR